MNIITEYDNIATSEKAGRVFTKLKDFVHSRLKVLEEQIDREAGTITIRIIPSGIDFQDFSPSLTEKMKSCITEEDLMHIAMVLIEEDSH